MLETPSGGIWLQSCPGWFTQHFKVCPGKGRPWATVRCPRCTGRSARGRRWPIPARCARAGLAKGRPSQAHLMWSYFLNKALYSTALCWSSTSMLLPYMETTFLMRLERNKNSPPQHLSCTPRIATVKRGLSHPLDLDPLLATTCPSVLAGVWP